MLKRSLICAAMLALTACTTTTDPAERLNTRVNGNVITAVVPVTDKFIKDELKWKGDLPIVSYEARYNIIRKDDRFLFCAAGSYRSFELRGGTQQVLSRRVLVRDGRPIINDFRFATLVPPSANLDTAMASCVDAGPFDPRADFSFDSTGSTNVMI